jgi:hypothetical protein
MHIYKYIRRVKSYCAIPSVFPFLGATNTIYAEKHKKNTNTFSHSAYVPCKVCPQMRNDYGTLSMERQYALSKSTRKKKATTDHTDHTDHTNHTDREQEELTTKDTKAHKGGGRMERD